MNFIHYLPFIFVSIIAIVIFIVVISTIIKNKKNLMDPTFLKNLQDINNEMEEKMQAGKPKRCNYCGTENASSATKCNSCGAPLNSKRPKQ